MAGVRGLDTLDKIGGIMFDEYKEKRYASPPLLKRMVSLGYFGRKRGKASTTTPAKSRCRCRWCNPDGTEG